MVGRLCFYALSVSKIQIKFPGSQNGRKLTAPRVSDRRLLQAAKPLGHCACSFVWLSRAHPWVHNEHVGTETMVVVPGILAAMFKPAPIGFFQVRRKPDTIQDQRSARICPVISASSATLIALAARLVLINRWAGALLCCRRKRRKRGVSS